MFTEINECESTPCLNGATCIDDVNKYRCTCVAGYDGVMCERGMLDNHNLTITEVVFV